jgi:hypothetical protein
MNDQRNIWARWSLNWAIVIFVIHIILTEESKYATGLNAAEIGNWASNTLWIFIIFVLVAVILLIWNLIRKNLNNENN